MTAVAVLTALALLAWAHFAEWGAVPGATSDSVRCADDNIPPWWPA